jgi:hypothetical protein
VEDVCGKLLCLNVSVMIKLKITATIASHIPMPRWVKVTKDKQAQTYVSLSVYYIPTNAQIVKNLY